MRAEAVEALARECGFDLAGVSPALPVQPDAYTFLQCVANGYARAHGLLGG